jgi:polysaccharide pyruvyl transferase WcaK-like protein
MHSVRSKLFIKFLSDAFFYPRDSLSERNFKKDTLYKNVILMPDLSFFAPHDIKSKHSIWVWVAAMKKRSQKIAIFTIAQRPSISDIGEFVFQIVTQINLWENWSFIIIPHSLDETTIYYSNLLFESLELDSRKFLLVTSDVFLTRALVTKVDLVCSTLMHSSLAAISAGKPTIFLDYQDK